MNRVVYHSSISDTHKNNIDAIYKYERDRWKQIKTDKNVKKHPAVQLFLFIHRRERATQMRGLKKKPIGFGSHDFHRKQRNIMNYDTYFPQIPIARRGLQIRSNDYMVQMNSILLTLMTPNDNEIGYFCSTSMLHESCYHKKYVVFIRDENIPFLQILFDIQRCYCR